MGLRPIPSFAAVAAARPLLFFVKKVSKKHAGDTPIGVNISREMEKGIKELEKYLPRDWENAAREEGAIIRGRGIKTAAELLEMNLLYLTVGESFGITAALINTATEKTMSKNAVYKRICGSWRWLRWMAQQLFEEEGLQIAKPEWLDKKVIAVDGSELSIKGSKKGDYWLHCAFDIFNFSYRSMEITEFGAGEKLSRHVIEPGDIVLADRAYGTIRGMEHVLAGDGDFILRYKTKGFNVYDEQGSKIDLVDRFSHLAPMETLSLYCFYVSEGKKRPVRLVAMRKDTAAIDSVRKKHRQKGLKTPSPEALALNQYIILATSLDETEGRILELYRSRWQIERVFLRLKEMYQFGQTPSKNEDSVKAWFYGKLFLAVLPETIMKRECFPPDNDMRGSSIGVGKLA